MSTSDELNLAQDKLTNWNLMIFDLLTSPQGHQADPMVNILLAFCSTHHPHQFDMSHDYVLKNAFMTPCIGNHKTWGMTQGAWAK